MNASKLPTFSRKRPEHFNAVYDTILDLVNTNKSFEWQELAAIVKNRFNVKNWIDVRIVLASARLDGRIYRTDDIHVERYVQGHNA